MPEILPPSPSTAEYYRPMEVWVVQPPRHRYWLHGLLLLLTIFTTLVVGARMQYNFDHNLPAFYIGDDALSIFPLMWAFHAANLMLGIPFSFTLMLILLAHEMGHYLTCRYYGIDATLPYFIPFPSVVGTMGAFIRIKSPFQNRAELLECVRQRCSYRKTKRIMLPFHSEPHSF